MMGKEKIAGCRCCHKPEMGISTFHLSFSPFPYQGFHSGGRGATMPSLASHSSSGSLLGSMPISLAYSRISEADRMINCD